MKKFFLIFLTITLISFGIEHNLYAQNEQSQYSIELQQSLQNRTESEKKVATDIYCKLFKFEKDFKDGKSIFESSKVFDEKYFRLDEQKRIFVNIRLSTKSITESNTVKQRILELNGKIKSIDSGHNGFVEIKCWIPIDKIKLLSNQSLINTIITPPPPQFWTITTEGDAQLKATDVRSNFNVNGTGYKIGVISDGAKSYGIVPPDELPNITILSAGDIDGDEGTAMLVFCHTNSFTMV